MVRNGSELLRLYPEQREAIKALDDIKKRCEEATDIPNYPLHSLSRADATFLVNFAREMIITTPRLVKALERCIKGIANLGEFYGAETKEIMKELRIVEGILNGEGE